MPSPSGGDAMETIKRIFETVAVVLVSAALSALRHRERRGRVLDLCCGSAVFRLLQTLYRAFLRVLRGSVILRALFAEGFLERAYRSSLVCRLLCALLALARRLLCRDL